MSVCPSCGHAFDRSSLSPARCGCGYDLTAEPTGTLASGDGIGDAYLIGRLGDGPHISHGFLDSLPFADAAEAMQWLGGAARWGGAISNWRSQESAERARTMAVGFAVCEDFPNRVEEVLNEMLSVCPPKRRSPKGVYGRLQSWLSQSTQVALDPIREIVRAHAVKHVPITTCTKLFRELMHEGDWTTLGELSRACGVSPGRIATVAAALKLIEPLRSNEKKTVVSKYLKTEIIAFFNKTCSAEEVRGRLGITAQAFKNLVVHSYIPRAFSIEGTSIPARYRLEDVDRFLIALHGDAPFMNAPRSGSATILEAVQICFRSSEAIIHGLMQGRIRATGRLRGKRGLAQILIDTYAVSSVL